MSQSRLTFFWGGAYLVSNLVECTWTLVKVVVDNAASKDQFKPAFSAFEKTTYVTCFYVPCDIFPNNNMILFWKPTRLKTKIVLGYNDVLKVWPHVIENNQAGTIVLEESPVTNFGNTPWHFRFSQHGWKPTTCSEMMMFRKFSQFDWKRAGTNVFEELPTTSTSEMHHEVSKLANIWRQPITFLEMITLRKFSQFDWWTSNAKKIWRPPAGWITNSKHLYMMTFWTLWNFASTNIEDVCPDQMPWSAEKVRNLDFR